MRLILFDIDGTLLDCGRQVRSFFAGALDRVFGTAGAIDEYDFAGRTDDRIATDLLQQAGVSRERIRDGLPRMKERYFRDLDEGLDRASMRVLPGVLATLETLAAEPEVKVGLLTGNWEQGARIKLGRVGLNRYFPFGAFGDDVKERQEMPPVALKSAGDLYDRAFSPAETVIVGDTERDVDCARAHGIGAIGVTTGRHSADQLAAAGATRVVRSLVEIL
ncbi:MAG: HAD family hydrolase [Acidobacteriota bacterium]|nr:HAD family hydrolase [Acidobacteriota bacterium]